MSLWVLTLTPSPWGHVLTLGLGNPQIVAIQTCSGTTLHEKINIYIYSFLFVFKEERKGNLCFLGEQQRPRLSCPLLPLESQRLWGLH